MNQLVVNTREAREAALDAELEELERVANNPAPAEEIVEELPALTKEEETWRQRHGDLRRHTQSKENAWKAKQAELENKIRELQGSLEATTKPSLEFPKVSSVEEARQWIQDFPEIAGVFKTILMEEFGSVKTDNEKIKKQMEADKVSLAQEKARLAILKAHPDFDELSEVGSELDEWLHEVAHTRGRLGQFYYDSLWNNDDFDAQRAIETLNAFKKERDEKKRPRKAPADTIAAPIPSRVPNAPENPSGKKQYLESDIENMNIREYERHEKDIEEARREGRIIYDVTGAAR